MFAFAVVSSEPFPNATLELVPITRGSLSSLAIAGTVFSPVTTVTDVLATLVRAKS